MMLSELQRYILKSLYGRSSLTKEDFLLFYSGKDVAVATATKDIVKSIDRLVARDLLKVSGVKTAKKWYTSSVQLTYKGEKMARSILVQQPTLFR